MSKTTLRMTPADIAAVIADLADIWRGSDEFPAIRSTAGGFLSALKDRGADDWELDAFWRNCRIDVPKETCQPTEQE